MVLAKRPGTAIAVGLIFPFGGGHLYAEEQGAGAVLALGMVVALAAGLTAGAPLIVLGDIVFARSSLVRRRRGEPALQGAAMRAALIVAVSLIVGLVVR